jgi:YVTN family beta-propeller protein
MRLHPVLTALLSAASLVVGAALLVAATGPDLSPLDHKKAKQAGSTSSGPIQITSDDDDIWVANPDRNSVTRIEVKKDKNRKDDEIKVGREPHGIAISPDDKYVYVANTQSGTVSVIKADSHHPRVWRTIRVGTEPYALALTPNGDKLYCANARSNDISVIDTDRLKVVRTLDSEDGVGLEPRALAITNDGDGSDTDEKLYVAQFLGVDKPGKTIGADDYKEAHVSVFSTKKDRFLRTVVLNPIDNVGFNASGNALAGIAPGANFNQPTGAFPNQLNSVVIKGGPRLPAEHRGVAERPRALQRQRAGVPVRDRPRHRHRGRHDQHEPRHQPRSGEPVEGVLRGALGSGVRAQLQLRLRRSFCVQPDREGGPGRERRAHGPRPAGRG